MERATMYEDRATRLDFMKRISWSAVFAGVLVAIVAQMLLTLLGLGIGLGTINRVPTPKMITTGMTALFSQFDNRQRLHGKRRTNKP